MGCGAAMGTGCMQCLVVVLTAGGTAFAVTLAARTAGGTLLPAFGLLLEHAVGETELARLAKFK